MVNNAVDAVLEHASSGDLWVRTAVRGHRLAVEFADSGPGVKEPSRVFDPFYTTKPVGKGTGLGLSICYGIVTEHGGSITVRNAQPHGASFTIELPFQSAAAPKGVVTQRSGAASREGRILLVDEDQSVLDVMGTILRGRNHVVHKAGTLAEAKSLLESQECDVIVSDIQIAEDTGHTGLSAWLKANQPALLHRLVWMRGSAPSGAGQEKPRAAAPVLQKPFKAGELLAVVESLLSDVHAAPIER